MTANRRRFGNVKVELSAFERAGMSLAYKLALLGLYEINYWFCSTSK